QNGTNLVKPVAQIRDGRKEALDHGPGETWFLLPGGDGVANQDAVQGQLPAMVGNNKDRPLSRDVIYAVGFDSKILFVEWAADGAGNLGCFNIEPPGVVAKATDGFLDFIHLLVQFFRNQPLLKQCSDLHSLSLGLHPWK